MSDETAAAWSDDSSAVMDAILAALRAGTEPDVERLAREYGEPVDEIRQLVDVVRLVGACADRSDGGVALDARVRVSPERPTLGDFRIIRELGRGGMGVVYEAEQVSLKRPVALKVLLPGVEVSEHALLRFEREAHAAGGLHHKHIVPVYAIGEDAGVPYFAMQFIQGEPLSGFIRGQRSQEPSRDAAYYRKIAGWCRTIADALAHAHRNGVIHRDVKPSNVMLDQAGQVWVTDFGLARADSSPTITMTGDLVGTVRYMSPEQARGAAIDERTDVYSLGVSLYELAVLAPPFDGPDRESTLKQVLLDTPQRPRQVDPGVPFPLQTIIEKAMARDPEQRYPSAALMSDDLDRFLDGRALIAEPPSLIRRAGDVVDRYKQLLALGGTLFAIVLGFAVWMSVLYFDAERLRVLAESGRDAALTAAAREQQASSAADAAALTADSIRQFLEDMLASVDPETARNRDTTVVRELLDAAAMRLDDELADQPAAQAALHETIGRTYQSIWEPELAAEHLESAVALRRGFEPGSCGEAADGADRCLTRLASALGYLSQLNGDQGRYAIALEHLDEAYTLLAGQPGADAQRAHIRSARGALLFKDGKLDAARAELEAGGQMLSEALPGDHRWTASNLHNRGLLAREQAHLDEAAELLEAAHAMRARLFGNIHPQVIASLDSLAAVTYGRGDAAAAVELYEQVLAGREELYSEEHPAVVQTLSSLSIALYAAGRGAEGLPLARRALETRRVVLGPDHPDLIISLINLAGFERTADHLPQAEALLREAVLLAERVLESPHPNEAHAKNHLARVLQAQERYDEAEPLLRAVVAARRALYGNTHPETAKALTNHASVLDDLQRFEEAAPLATEAYEIVRARYPATDSRVLAALTRVATTQMNSGALDDAEATFFEVLEGHIQAFGEDDWRVALIESRLGECLTLQERYDEAEPLLTRGVQGLLEEFGPQSSRVELAIYRVLSLYRAWERPEEAAWTRPIAADALRIRTEADPVDPRQVGWAEFLLGNIDLMLGDAESAYQYLSSAYEHHRPLFPADHHQLAGNRSSLGAALTQLGRYEEAEQHLLVATEILEQAYGAEHKAARRAKRRLDDLYEVWERGSGNGER